MSIVLNSVRYLNDLKENGDPRTRDYGIVLSPAFVFPLIFVYLYFVKIAGPRWMKTRDAFKIPTIIRMYNLGMVVLNARFLYLLLKFTYAPGGRYSLFCQGITGKMDSQMAVLYKAGWWYVIVRYADFLDTVFFVLRKKFNQVSNLHVIHHILVVFNAWFWVLVAPEGQPALGLCINTFVHVIMYSYYFLSTFGPEVRQYLWWKRYLTTLQIWQFIVFIIHMCIPLFYDCGFPKKLVPFAVAQALLVLGMFLNFYYHSYIKPRQNSASENVSYTKNENGKMQPRKYE
ncbi:elongation of very long chain fatty acids protein 4-like [Ixodes scapularis]|uniref:Elongation of very long chain fatty acids protein n=1 Tax=Ixodes scapularis TaxID=6945 RepID=B7QN76_IXOSC|nr:elongation of very long chain fatty acids protein 4 [Ixodes scapularis]XP_040079691.1 elongation of very long chain fatty acids protein 4-like [Ixodes scapularis]EEC20298.1 fatty acyl-CoA elongase, putative [Ixodes scapularis]|eukprot:XP_002400756.1 fatty acyl-CoA elongase, putative [Ixodes scapularis]